MCFSFSYSYHLLVAHHACRLEETSKVPLIIPKFDRMNVSFMLSKPRQHCTGQKPNGSSLNKQNTKYFPSLAIKQFSKGMHKRKNLPFTTSHIGFSLRFFAHPPRVPAWAQRNSTKLPLTQVKYKDPKRDKDWNFNVGSGQRWRCTEKARPEKKKALMEKTGANVYDTSLLNSFRVSNSMEWNYYLVGVLGYPQVPMQSDSVNRPQFLPKQNRRICFSSLSISRLFHRSSGWQRLKQRRSNQFRFQVESKSKYEKSCVCSVETHFLFLSGTCN